MSALRKPLHVALIAASTAHRKKCLRDLYALGLTEGQPKVLAHLLSQEGVLQKDLAKSCQVEPATMTSLLRRMEDQGLIRKEEARVSGGKRAFRVCLTDHGRDIAWKAMGIIDQFEKQCYDGFTEEEIDLLLSLLDRVAKNIGE